MIGSLSDRDIAIRAAAEGMDSGTRVGEVMSEGVVCAHEHDAVANAALAEIPKPA